MQNSPFTVIHSSVTRLSDIEQHIPHSNDRYYNHEGSNTFLTSLLQAFDDHSSVRQEPAQQGYFRSNRQELIRKVSPEVTAVRPEIDSLVYNDIMSNLTENLDLIQQNTLHVYN